MSDGKFKVVSFNVMLSLLWFGWEVSYLNNIQNNVKNVTEEAFSFFYSNRHDLKAVMNVWHTFASACFCMNTVNH